MRRYSLHGVRGALGRPRPISRLQLLEQIQQPDAFGSVDVEDYRDRRGVEHGQSLPAADARICPATTILVGPVLLTESGAFPAICRAGRGAQRVPEWAAISGTARCNERPSP